MKALTAHAATYFLIKLWYESDNHVTTQVVSDREPRMYGGYRFASDRRLA